MPPLTFQAPARLSGMVLERELEAGGFANATVGYKPVVNEIVIDADGLSTDQRAAVAAIVTAHNPPAVLSAVSGVYDTGTHKLLITLENGRVTAVIATAIPLV